MAKPKVMAAGERYGQLVVVVPNIRRASKLASRPLYYAECVCDCGNEVLANQTQLRTGRKKSCPNCGRRSHLVFPSGGIGRSIHLGSRHGAAVVIGMDIVKKSGRSVECRCDCGKKFFAQVKRIASGLLRGCKSCVRRLMRKYQPGEQVGNWIVVKYLTEENRYECKCVCGKILVVQIGDMERGGSKCMACAAKERRIGAKRWYWTQMTKGALSRSLEVTVTPDEAFALLERQGYACALSGLPIVVAETTCESKRGGTTASLDRIDSSKGYTLDNIQWLHKTVNRIKTDLGQQEFVDICKRIADRAA